ncbi:MAG: hypothetical protein KatS3mg110_0775 [Pirellulaceae bacterium]|nr:MAG: hypothetical protein KatS3mg110_0775 [Pirellulaceae bacterium]
MTQDERIRELLSAYVDGEVTADEQARAEAYIRSSDEWRQYYEELLAIRQAVRDLPTYSPSYDVAGSILEKARRERGVNRRSSVSTLNARGLLLWRWSWLAVAATAILVLGSALYLAWNRPPRITGPVDSFVGGPKSVTNPGQQTAPRNDGPKQTDAAPLPEPASAVAGAASRQPGERNVPAPQSEPRSDAVPPDRIASSPQPSHTLPPTPRIDSSGPGQMLPLTAMVIDLVLTDKGVTERVVEQTWNEVGIPTSQAIGVDPALEKALLGQRFFGALGPQELPAEEVGSPATISYFRIYFLVATGRQIDAFLQRLYDLRTTGDVSLLRLDLALGTSDSALFSLLERQSESARTQNAAGLVGVHPLVLDEQVRARLSDALLRAQRKQNGESQASPENLPPTNTDTPSLQPENLAEMEQILFKVLLVVRSEATVRNAR